jgi:hypothetical protein
MAITEHDRKVGALLGLDPAMIAENSKAEEEWPTSSSTPMSRR